MQGERRFYAFVAFEEEEAAKKSIDELHGKFLEPENKTEEDQPLFVVFVQPKKVRQALLAKEHLNFRNTTNLFVKSLKDTITEEDIIRVFGKFGKITSCVVKGTKPIFLGGTETMKFAYVNFANADNANDAYLKGKKDPEVKELLHALHKENLDFISYHQPKTVREQYLRIKNRMKAAMQMPPQYGMPMMRGGPYPFKKNKQNFNGNFGGMNFGGPNMFPMGGFMPGMIPDMGMNMMGGMPLASPSTLQNSTPSNSSRPGEKKEDYNVEWLKKNKKEFMAMDKEKQNNVMGNLMYNRVLASGLTTKDLVPKVTGMLIDIEILDYEEIIEILINDESLKERINEAVEVINETPSA
jgi:RNA recognition motif-containing protein